MKIIKPFQINVNGKLLDYRIGKNLDLDKVEPFFQKKYQIEKLWNAQRHVVGILKKNNQKLFLKLSTSEGISEITKNEYLWNEEFNKLVPRESSSFWVPKNFDSGLFDNSLFYIITDFLNGTLLAQNPQKLSSEEKISKNISQIINFAEKIQNLKSNFSEEENYLERFKQKSLSWFQGIPENIRKIYKIKNLLNTVIDNAKILNKKPRHGDFSPWHIFDINQKTLGLIDGEHAASNGVEYYDIAYFIQRVYSVNKNPQIAQTILEKLIQNGYNLKKLKVVLSARAIGGFLDESLNPKPDYFPHHNFQKWINNL